jgi:vacuolar-type H+-ATPase subunit I/STV1
VDVLIRSLQVVEFVFVTFILLAPIAMGAFALFFSRRFSVAAYRYRQKVWKIGYSEFDVRVGQLLAAVVGGVLLIVGLAEAARYLF